MIKIEPSIRDSLVLRIADGLKSVKLYENLNIVLPSEFKWARELNDLLSEESREKIMRYCGDGGVLDYVYGEISRYLTRVYSTPRDGVKSLADIAEFSDTINYAKKLVDRMISLPLKYRITICLPNLWPESVVARISKIKVGDGVFVCSMKGLKGRFPKSSGDGHIDKLLFDDDVDFINKKYSEDSSLLYLVQYLPGYDGDYGAAPVLSKAEANLKCFLGAGLAVGLIDCLGFSVPHREDQYFLVHYEDGAEVELHNAGKASASVSDLYSRCNDLVFLLGGGGGLIPEIEEKIRMISTVFRNNDYSRRMNTACVWYFRSHFSGNTLDGLLESTIAIESLLGDRLSIERSPLSDMLANRCAFLLGKTPNERDDIVRRFKEIYKLRSNIVHAGKHFIEPRERSVIMESRKLAGEIIVKEMSNTLES